MTLGVLALVSVTMQAILASEAPSSRHMPRAPVPDDQACISKLFGSAYSQAECYAMIQRHAVAAGIGTSVCNHTFRTNGITAYLKTVGTPERAANIAKNASTRTAQLYDCRSDGLSLDEIERILI